LVFGTLLRQAYNEGPLPSKTKITADLRSVGWGGRRQDIAHAYNAMVLALSLTADKAVSNTDLNSFNKPPPASWRKTGRSNQPRTLNYAVIILVPSGTTETVQTRINETASAKPLTVIDTLTRVEAGFNQDKQRVVSGPTGQQINAAKKAGIYSAEWLHEHEVTEPYPETFVTLEYAGVRVLKKSR
jgi:hypothetical protein